MSNRQKAKKARKEGKGFDMEIIEECITCSRKEIGEIMLLKIPEGILMCLNCSPKHRDEKVYKGFGGGWLLYKIGFGPVDENGTVIV